MPDPAPVLVDPPRPVTPTAIVAAELADICEQVDGPLRERLCRVRDLAAGLEPYLHRCTTPESAALAALARRTAETDWDDTGLEQEMLSGHVEGQLLKFLVWTSGARRVLEIGMFTGYSALAMAEALPADGQLVACEMHSAVAALALESFADSPAGARITVEVGPAMDTLERLAGDAAVAPFDLVFVDADKTGYLGYFEFLLDSGLLAEGALIAVDNTLLQGGPYAHCTSANGSAIASFNAAVADDPRVEQVLIPLRDGLTLIRRVDR